jgi:methionine aminopeptidase
MEASMSTSPDQQLKEKIIASIKKEGLLTARDLKKLEDNYLQKGISVEDWNLFVDNRIHEEEVKNAKQD